MKIIGDASTGAQITPATDLSFSLSQILYNGKTVIFYSDSQGVKLLSFDGASWKKSVLILAKNGDSPYFLRDSLFFIDSQGLKVKTNMIMSIYNATEMNEQAGISQTNIELAQQKIDSNTPILVTPIVTTIRRLAAFISVDGTYNVAFYDDAGILNCFSSTNQINWQPNYNF
jgi:hypothetical protein